MLPAIPPIFSVTALLAPPIAPSHLPYSSFHDSSFLTTSLDTAIDTKGLSADPWCKPTVSGNSADSPHCVLTLVVAPLYISSTKSNICPGTRFFLGHQNVSYLGTLSNAFSESK